MALMAVSAMTSIGSAFAFSPAAKLNAQKYYAVRNAAGTGFNWQTTQPTGKSCSDTAESAICSILTSTPPTNNVVPSGHLADMTLYK